MTDEKGTSNIQSLGRLSVGLSIAATLKKHFPKLENDQAEDFGFRIKSAFQTASYMDQRDAQFESHIANLKTSKTSLSSSIKIIRKQIDICNQSDWPISTEKRVTFVGTLDSAANALEEALADLEEPAPHWWRARRRGQPPKFIAKMVTAELADVIKEIQGRYPSYTTDYVDGQRKGAFVDILDAIFEDLGVTAVARSQVGQNRKGKKSKRKENKYP